MTFKELKDQLDELNESQLNKEIYIRFIDKRLKLNTIKLIGIENGNDEKSNLNWAWIFAEPITFKEILQLEKQEKIIVRPR